MINTKFFAGCLCRAVLLLAVSAFIGCQPGMRKKKGPTQAGRLFTVDFTDNTVLTYRFVCSRSIKLNLDPSGKYTRGGKKSGYQKYSEKLELEISYKPIKVNPYGYSVIQARCLQARVTKQPRRRISGRGDAVEQLKGKTFTLKITPSGKIVDYSSLTALLRELGRDAFGHSRGGSRRIKNPDMIMDFAATQWGLWNSIGSVDKPLEGIKLNQTWQSRLPAPMPFVSRTARNVKYKLAGFEQVNGRNCAVIESTYSLADKPVENLPLPYTGSFQMRGTFGFLRGYKVHSIQGSGRQIFDVKKGLVISDDQSYRAIVSASIFGLGSGTMQPNIIIDQTIKTELIE